MNNVLYHAEIKDRRGAVRTVDAIEHDVDGTIEISASDYATGEKVAVTTAFDKDAALKAFDALVDRCAHPLQAAFNRAHMVSGRRYTLVCMGDFGMPVAVNMTFDFAELDIYAQYDDAVRILCKPARKRMYHEMWLYNNRAFAIYDGWRTLDDNMVWNNDSDRCKMSKYPSFDDRYMRDIIDAWPDYIACYDSTASACQDEPGAEECQLAAEEDSCEPREIIPGLTLVRDEDEAGKMRVDMTPEMFAYLYATNPSHLYDGAHLVWALRRATVACMAHVTDVDDGTCNFDSPVLLYKGHGMSQSEARLAVESAGLHGYVSDAGLVIDGCLSGQGNRRSRMAEAFVRSLKDDGICASVYYAMD